MANYFENKIDEYESRDAQEIFDKTDKYQKKLNFKGEGHNDEKDAFRHAFGSAVSVFKYTILGAKLAGDRHEDKGRKEGQDPKEENMDRWNNAVGREIAKEVQKELKGKENVFTQEHIEDMIADKIMKRMKKGDLITDPDKDTRKFENSRYNGRVYTRDDIGKMSSEEFQQHEAGIMAQMREKGVPTNAEAEQKAASGDLVYVKGYTREDGTDVKGYYRSK